MEDYVAKTLIGAIISWTIIFLFLRKLLPNYSFDFCSRLLATTHATLAVILASLTVQDWSCPFYPLNSYSTKKQMQTLTITTGYMIYDLICSHFDEKTNSLDNSFHHLVSIVGIGGGLVYKKCGSELGAALFITEISTPFLHLREFLKEIGYKDTDLNLAADILFAVTFSVARIIGAPYLLYVTLTVDNPLLIKVTATGLQLVSIFWFYKIVKMVHYKLAKRTAIKKSA